MHILEHLSTERTAKLSPAATQARTSTTIKLKLTKCRITSCKKNIKTFRILHRWTGVELRTIITLTRRKTFQSAAVARLIHHGSTSPLLLNPPLKSEDRGKTTSTLWAWVVISYRSQTIIMLSTRSDRAVIRITPTTLYHRATSAATILVNLRFRLKPDRNR